MATVTPLPVRPGRSLELSLLLIALTLGVGAYALVGLATAGALPTDIVGYSAGLVALSLGMHVVLRWRAPYADPVILPVVVALNGIGLAMIYRIDLAYEARDKAAGFADRRASCGPRSPWCSRPSSSGRCATTARCAGTRTPRWSSASD